MTFLPEIAPPWARRSYRRATIGALVVAAGCGAPSAPPSGPGDEAPAVAAEAVTAAPPAARPLTRTPLGEPRAVTLPVHLVPSRDRRACLVVHDDPTHVRSYYRRIDAAGPGPLRVVDGRRVVASVELADGPRIVSSDGRRVCVDEACHPVRPAAVLALGARRLALLEQRPVEAPDDRGASDGASSADGDTKPEERPEIAIWVHPLDARGRADGDAFESGLRFVRPLEGMGLVDAIATPSGAALLHYEEARPRREGKREVPRAKLAIARLDATGALVAGSRRPVLEGDRRYGYVEGHHRQRLFGIGDAVVVIGRHVDAASTPRARFEGHRPGGPAVTGSDALFGLDPDRLAAGADGAIEAQLAALFDRAPRLVVGQPGSDAGRVAWVGDRGWFLVDGGLETVAVETTALAGSAGDTEGANDPGGAAAIVARRARIRWAHLEPDGEGLAGLDDATVHVAKDGALTTTTGSMGEIISPPVRIEGAFWAIARRGDAAGAAVVRLWPTPHEGAAATAGETALADGWILRREGGSLAVERLAPDGTGAVVARAPSPFDGRFLAAGSVVAGERGGQIVAAALDPEGRLSAAVALGPGRLEGLARHPDGALVTTRDRLIWLDDRGHPLAEATRPPPAYGAPCVDGRPPPAAIPRGPGVLEPLAAPADACVVSDVVTRRDGSLRWLGSRVDGADAQAELVALAPPTLAETEVAAAPGDGPPPHGIVPEIVATPSVGAPPRCPPEMVSVGAFCIDRYEARLADADGALLSPDYPPSPALVDTIFKAWAFGRFYEGDVLARAMPLPPLGRAPTAAPRFVARSERGVAPSGYLSGFAAAKACEAAGKRLCRHEEWVRACRGEAQTKFPYGDDYEHGACNVFRYDHPARILHGNAAVGHLDPRLNRAVADDGPMRHDTGANPRCASRWGNDAIYDMVGNLDEWIDRKGGAFAGGFYARATRSGCDALISVHPRRYFDYSLTVRCCRDARRAP